MPTRFQSARNKSETRGDGSNNRVAIQTSGDVGAHFLSQPQSQAEKLNTGLQKIHFNFKRNSL